MGSRRQSRELALQVLFQADFSDSWELETVNGSIEHFGVNTQIAPYAKLLSEGVVENKDSIDSLITIASQRWSLTRMSRVDRSIIRLATYELSMMADVPARVAINEAIEIAKRFGTEDSPTFINGVLDKVASNYAEQSEEAA